MKRVLVFLLIALAAACARQEGSSPSRIVLIRHADKLPQKNYGHSLSPKGQVRAERFVGYFMGRFGAPDFLFATKPVEQQYEFSLREMQTLAPLANYLTQLTQTNVMIYQYYPTERYAEMAELFLRDPKYRGKTVLICWDHYNLVRFMEKLGVKQAIPAPREDVFDTVYIMDYNPEGNIRDFQILENQYPVEDPGSWEALFRCGTACAAKEAPPTASAERSQ